MVWRGEDRKINKRKGKESRRRERRGVRRAEKRKMDD